MFTVRNATLVALMQVGVIFAGIAASGLWHKAEVSNEVLIPSPTLWLYNYGILGFIIPPAWLTSALLLQIRPEISDEVKNLVFWLGMLILITLVVFMIYANVLPCFRIVWHTAGGDDA